MSNERFVGIQDNLELKGSWFENQSGDRINISIYKTDDGYGVRISDCSLSTAKEAYLLLKQIATLKKYSFKGETL